MTKFWVNGASDLIFFFFLKVEKRSDVVIGDHHLMVQQMDFIFQENLSYTPFYDQLANDTQIYLQIPLEISWKARDFWDYS